MSTFQFNGKHYQVNEKQFPKVNIPGIGERTALEILADEKAQEKLVVIGSEVVFEVEAPEEEVAENKEETKA